ncbi:phenylalanine--tRNA ligase subunit beta [bacterium]|nr:phenylalanine--tRNA ligase subunit beta [bacterium]
MKLSTNWLRQFVGIDASPQEIAEILTFQAFELEGMEEIHRNVKGVVVGEIVKATPHPDADKLIITNVDIGSEELEIVCGAPNCREGIKVAVAPPGTRLDGITIEAKKLRGVLSHGMILSEKELAITDDHSGVLELDETVPVGTRLETLVEASDTILDFEITVNRPDGLSHLGVARELAAHFRLPLQRPVIVLNETEQPVSDHVSVEIVDPEISPRYVARMVEGVTIRKSPLWMRALLYSLGQRPINNVVDITNYVLFELGHPIHAFDLRLVKDGRIIVRPAYVDEKLITLDDQERSLVETDIVIADPEKGIGLGGVMGGANSEVGEDSTGILIEAAYFHPVSIRKTAKRLGLQTEASRRFERGADPDMAPVAASRCAQLLEMHGDGVSLKGVVDTYPEPFVPRTVTMRPSRAALILGYKPKRDDMAGALRSLELEVDDRSEDTLEVTVPLFRMHDLQREIDLIEEIARILGYRDVPTAATSKVVLGSSTKVLEEIVEAAVDTMTALGYNETVHTAMVSSKLQEAFGAGLRPVPIVRPINPDMNAYRASLLPDLLRTAGRHLRLGNDSVRLFETGQLGGSGPLSEDNGQRVHLAFVACGYVHPNAYDRNTYSFDLQDLKGDLSDLRQGLSLEHLEEYTYAADDPLLRERLELRDKSGLPVLYAGRLDPSIADEFDIQVDTYVCEIDLERWTNIEPSSFVKRPGIARTYRRFSRFPTNERDLAFLVEGRMEAEHLLELIRENAGPWLETVELFDYYEGKPLKKGQRSLAFHLVFRAEDRTLQDEEIIPYIDRVVSSVTDAPGVELRT